MTTRTKMHGFRSQILQGNVSVMAMVRSLEGRMLTMADEIGQVVAEEGIEPGKDNAMLAQDVAMAMGALEEMVDALVELLEEEGDQEEVVDADDRFEITEKGSDALFNQIFGTHFPPGTTQKGTAEKDCARRGIDYGNIRNTIPDFPVGTELKAFVPSGRVTVRELAKEMGRESEEGLADIETALRDVSPVADFEGEPVYSRIDVMVAMCGHATKKNRALNESAVGYRPQGRKGATERPFRGRPQ